MISNAPSCTILVIYLQTTAWRHKFLLYVFLKSISHIWSTVVIWLTTKPKVMSSYYPSCSNDIKVLSNCTWWRTLEFLEQNLNILWGYIRCTNWYHNSIGIASRTIPCVLRIDLLRLHLIQWNVYRLACQTWCFTVWLFIQFKHRSITIEKCLCNSGPVVWFSVSLCSSTLWPHRP